MISYPPTLNYRADIDGLRAIAVLAVVVFHAFPAALKGGFIGVDIFFVISGFLISSIIFAQRNQGTFSVVQFYIRRIKRIFPSLILMILSFYLLGWFTLLADEFKQLGKHIVGGATFTSNFLFWSESGYFDNEAETKPLLHLWSLGIEEQFYILWPFLLWLTPRNKSALLGTIICLTGTSLLANFISVFQEPTAAFYLPHTRLWELSLGSLLAWISTYQPKLANSLRQPAISVTGASLIIIGVTIINKGNLFPGAWALIPTIGATLLICGGEKNWVNKNILAHPALVWIGLISYPLYLWHWPMLAFARITAGGPPSNTMLWAAIACAFILSCLSYRFVERPVRESKHQTRYATLLLTGLVLLGACGLYTYKMEGFPNREFQLNNDNNHSFDWPDSKYIAPGCLEQVGLTDTAYCRMSYSKTPQVVLLGDSHANAIFDLFDMYFSAQKKSALILGKSGCPPFLSVERGTNGCESAMGEMVNYINNNKEITSVYLTGRFAAAESGINFGGKPFGDNYQLIYTPSPEITDRKEIFKLGLTQILQSLLAHEKRVTVILDVPELNFDPRACVGARNKHECFINKSQVTEHQATYTRIIRELQAIYNFKVIDPKDFLCQAERCIAKHDGKILYRDNHHLGLEGSKYLLNQQIKLD